MISFLVYMMEGKLYKSENLSHTYCLYSFPSIIFQSPFSTVLTTLTSSGAMADMIVSD